MEFIEKLTENIAGRITEHRATYEELLRKLREYAQDVEFTRGFLRRHIKLNEADAQLLIDCALVKGDLELGPSGRSGRYKVTPAQTIFLLTSPPSRGIKASVQDLQYWKSEGYHHIAYETPGAITLSRSDIKLDGHCSYEE